jgi:hypothetical protein
MTTTEALNYVDSILSQLALSRDQHTMVMKAVGCLRKATAEDASVYEMIDLPVEGM